MEKRCWHCRWTSCRQTSVPVLFVFLLKYLQFVNDNTQGICCPFVCNVIFTFLLAVGILRIDFRSNSRYPLERTVQVFAQLRQHLCVFLQLLAGGFQMIHGQGITVGQHFVGLLEPLQP